MRRRLREREHVIVIDVPFHIPSLGEVVEQEDTARVGESLAEAGSKPLK
jgi:hypothetical protein